MEPQKKYPAFLKPYFADCSNRLQIHAAFSPFMKSSVPEKVSLRNCKGKLWPVEVAKIGDNFYFQQGWKKFIEENHIEYGDLLACHYRGENIFDLKNLGKMASEKEINEAFGFNRQEKQVADDMLNKTTLKRKHVDVSPGAEAADLENVDENSPYGYRKTGHTSGNPYFVIKLREHNRLGHLVVNASEIFNDNGVKLNEVMTVRDPCGRSWRSKVSQHKDGRILLEEWDLLCENKLDYGDECVCVIVGEKEPYIQVYINRRKATRIMETRADRMRKENDQEQQLPRVHFIDSVFLPGEI